MSSRYRQAGVDLSLAERAMERIRPLVESTHGPEVAAGFGAFAGMWRVPGADGVLLAATMDGVGTKIRIAQATGRHTGIGSDLVNHCVNDVLASGARPAFFLDYFACGRLDPVVLAGLVEGMTASCRAARCALLGGETAEMPGFYGEEEYDLAGCMVGIARESAGLPSAGRVERGDALIGYASTGLHTNGYSLARRVLLGEMKLALDSAVPGTGGTTLADALLAVHRSYLPAIEPALEAGAIRGLAHITGGGIPGNLNRALPPHLAARIVPGTWSEPPIFDLIRRGGNVGEPEMRSVFNLGVGMIAVVAPSDVDRVRADASRAGIETGIIGEIVPGDGGVRFADPPRGG